MHKHQRLIRQLAAIPHKEFLLHGSPSRHGRRHLRPRRPPTHFKHRRELNKKRIYATSVIAIGLLYAVIRSPSSAWTWSYQRDEEGRFRLHVRPEPGQRLFMKRYGYLYVVPRALFRSIQNVLIYCSAVPMQPVRVIRVSAGAALWYFNHEGCRFVREYPKSDQPIRPPLAYRRVKPRR